MLVYLRKLFWVTLLFLAILPIHVTAQDGTRLINSNAVEVLFPAGIRFSLDLDLAADDLGRVSLVVEQDGRILRTGGISLDDVELVSDGGVTRVLYFMPTAPTDSLRLFEPVTYQWAVSTTEALQDDANGQFVFEPAGDKWRHESEPPLGFSLFDDNLNVHLAGQNVLPAYELMVEHTGLTPEILWLVQPGGFSYCSVVDDNVSDYSCDEDGALRFFAQENYQLVERTAPGLLPFQRSLVVALFEEFYGQYWQGSDVPDWFRAGLQQYYSVTPEPFILRQVRSAARLGDLFDWAAFTTRPDQMAGAVGFWEQQAYTLVLYLADVYGAEVPFELAQTIPEQGFAAALQAAIDSDFDLFLVDWERWLFTADARAAASKNIYLPEIFLPTVTASPVPTITEEAP